LRVVNLERFSLEELLSLLAALTICFVVISGAIVLAFRPSGAGSEYLYNLVFALLGYAFRAARRNGGA
jgi:hypothetical protein